MKTALFFAAACSGIIACGGHDQRRVRAPLETSITTTTSGEQRLATDPIGGYAPGESQLRTNSTNGATPTGEAVPVPDTSTEVPGDVMTRDAGTLY